MNDSIVIFTIVRVLREAAESSADGVIAGLPDPGDGWHADLG